MEPCCNKLGCHLEFFIAVSFTGITALVELFQLDSKHFNRFMSLKHLKNPEHLKRVKLLKRHKSLESLKRLEFSIIVQDVSSVSRVSSILCFKIMSSSLRIAGVKRPKSLAVTRFSTVASVTKV